ncbi:MAG TPA: protein kinase [Polyangia bacterium]
MRQAVDSLSAGRGAGTDRSGTVVAGRFRLEALISREGGTEVYQAIDGSTGAAHAVRVVPFAAITGSPERLISDLEKTQALRHKNLVEVEAAGADGDLVYVAAELIDGQTLRDFIDAKRTEGRGVSLKGACNLVAHVANALEYASRVARHGALNPAIIWVNRAGRVKVSGLGVGPSVAGFARHGAPAGFSDTVYMAPEIVAGGLAKAAADVYSLGVIFYELITGAPPTNPFQPASRLAPDVPTSVDQVIARALSHAPEDRWPTLTAFKDALQQTGGPLPSATQTYGGAGPRNTAAAPAAVSVPVAGVPANAQTARPPSGRPTGGLQLTASPRPAAAPAARATATAMPAPVAPAAAPTPRASQPQEALPPRPSTQDSGLVPLPVGPEDHVEHWLIHKDNLDFGPFSMVQIRAQIERGEILADHLVIDNDSGTKCRVRDIPGLGHMAKHAGRRLEQARRAQAEQRSDKSEKRKSVFTGVVVTLVLLAVAAGVGIFLLTRHDTSGGHLASREEEAEIDNFLKGVKIGVTKAMVRRGGGGTHHAGGGNQSGGAAEDFNNDSSFGDVGKGLNEGDQTLDDDQIQNTMMANYRKLIPCIVHSPGLSNIALEFAVRGNGKVSAVKVNGQRTGALPACMLGRMQSFSFPKFNGAKTIASWSMSMGR